jgi:hypothetical protein
MEFFQYRAIALGTLAGSRFYLTLKVSSLAALRRYLLRKN